MLGLARTTAYRAFGRSAQAICRSSSRPAAAAGGMPSVMTNHHHQQPPHHHQRRSLSFTFAGPRDLNEIIKADLLENKSGAEIADIWYTYHESRQNVHGLVLKGKEGADILSRAPTW